MTINGSTNSMKFSKAETLSRCIMPTPAHMQQ
jgi:hypothetical protein